MARSPVFTSAEALQSLVVGDSSPADEPDWREPPRPAAASRSPPARGSASSSEAPRPAFEEDLEEGSNAEHILSKHGSERRRQISGNICPLGEDPDDSEDPLRRAKSRRLRKRCAWGSCCCLVLGLLAFTVLLLWPKDPIWQVTEINFSKQDISSMIQAFTSPNFASTVKIPGTARVHFDNPNYIGAEVGEGSFDVFFRGLKLATATSKPMTVPARDSSDVETLTTVLITPEVSKTIMPAVMPSFQMTVDVVGKLPARALGLRLSVSLSCSVDLNVIAIVSDPAGMITDHRCKYGI